MAVPIAGAWLRSPKSVGGLLKRGSAVKAQNWPSGHRFSGAIVVWSLIQIPHLPFFQAMLSRVTIPAASGWQILIPHDPAFHTVLCSLRMFRTVPPAAAPSGCGETDPVAFDAVDDVVVDVGAVDVTHPFSDDPHPLRRQVVDHVVEDFDVRDERVPLAFPAVDVDGFVGGIVGDVAEDSRVAHTVFEGDSFVAVLEGRVTVPDLVVGNVDADGPAGSGDDLAATPVVVGEFHEVAGDENVAVLL